MIKCFLVVTSHEMVLCSNVMFPESNETLSISNKMCSYGSS